MMDRLWCRIYFCSKKFSIAFSCIAALCCFFAAPSEGLSSDKLELDKEESTMGPTPCVCKYGPRELETIGLFGGIDHASSHLAIKCAVGAVAGAAVGSKFGGVLGATSGAAAGCYLFASGSSLDGLLYKLDRYIGLTPTPLDNCNQHCKELGPSDQFCKEAK